jgi:hypothetical protein
MNVQFQKLQQSITLCFLELSKPSHKSQIDIQRFEPGNGVSTDRGVVSVDWCSIWFSTPGIEDRIIYFALISVPYSRMSKTEGRGTNIVTEMYGLHANPREISSNGRLRHHRAHIEKPRLCHLQPRGVSPYGGGNSSVLFVSAIFRQEK